MATKSKYRELNIGPSEPITRRNSVAGMLVASDSIDPITNQRTLLLKRIESVEAVPVQKFRAKRRYKVRTNAGVVKTAQQEQTGFAEADRGA